ncbi:hypothetical protein DH2020_049370 [Rehmannia glutinosa]|uniref:Uncharacterized protein n=1 Tax=Rehmannia glutinosa TaxID=99300 RepID=A0ABR0U3G9_REHGL
MSKLPFRSFRHLAEQFGPIMLLKFCEVPIVVVSSPEIAKQILKDNDPNYADRPESIVTNILWYANIDIVFCQYGEYWRQMRKICIVELLSAKNVRSFGSIRNDEVSGLMKSIRLSSGKPINLTEMIFSLSSSITCRAAFGKVCKDSDTLIRLMNDILQMASGFAIADLFPSSKILNALSKPRLLMKRRKLDAILDDIINEHKENLAKMAGEIGDFGQGKDSARRGNGEFGNEDLVDVLLRIKENGELEFPIGNDNIKGVLYDIFIAGTETSPTTIDWAMAELMRNPRVMARCKPKFENLAVDFVGSDFQYLPFGAGKRMCPGMTFGLASVELPLAQLLYSLTETSRWWQAESLNMIENTGLTATRKDNLFVVPAPKHEPLA